MSNMRNSRDEAGQHFLPGGRTGFLLTHGLGGTPVEMRFVAHALNRAGYTVLCPMLAGHGGSEMLLNTARWQDWVDTADRAFDRLREHCDQVVVGGLSAGAIVSLHLAARRRDEVEALVLYSPTFWPNGWAIPWYFPAFRLITQRWFANLLSLRTCPPYGIKDDRIRRFVLESLQSDGRPLQDIFGRRGGTVFEFKKMTAAARRLLPEISLPTLVCHARNDDQSDLGNAMLVQRRMAGRVEMVVLEDCYHMITLDRQRSIVVDRTLAFAKGLNLEAAKEPVSQDTSNIVAGPTRA